jgi:hypothetical protein
MNYINGLSHRHDSALWYCQFLVQFNRSRSRELKKNNDRTYNGLFESKDEIQHYIGLNMYKLTWDGDGVFVLTTSRYLVVTEANQRR